MKSFCNSINEMYFIFCTTKYSYHVVTIKRGYKKKCGFGGAMGARAPPVV